MTTIPRPGSPAGTTTSSAASSPPSPPTGPPIGLAPLAESFPRSQKIAVGDLQVPARDVHLTDGSVVRVYDTTGPQGHDVQHGLPRRRQPWIDARVRRGDSNFSQLHYARRGIVTEEMAFVAIRENVDPEYVRSEI